jgi:holo-[acyl-carrier protein] synthase
MIFGIGTDLVDRRRVADIWQRFGERFARRILLPEEWPGFERARRKGEARVLRFLAQRFAAKEAIVKALGTGFAHGMWVRDCGIVQNTWGRPEIIWSARGQRRAAELGAGKGFISLSDEGEMVLAVAVLECR